jgi:hypothetical protein
VAGQQLGPKTGLRHPDCVLGTTLSLYYARWREEKSPVRRAVRGKRERETQRNRREESVYARIRLATGFSDRGFCGNAAGARRAVAQEPI